MTWLKSHWKLLASVALTALVSLNAAFGWIPDGTMATILAIAAAAGVTVTHGVATDAKETARIAMRTAGNAHDVATGVVTVSTPLKFGAPAGPGTPDEWAPPRNKPSTN